jgi:hypothetical protein
MADDGLVDTWTWELCRDAFIVVGGSVLLHVLCMAWPSRLVAVFDWLVGCP